jgi:putative transposase
MEIITLLQSINHLLNKTTWRQLVLIIEAMVSMTGRVTMLGLSRWTEAGGSYRTIQRFFKTEISWPALNLALFQGSHYKEGEIVALAGDHTVVTKAGKKTHGLDRFFSSMQGKTVKGLEFFSLSLINVTRRKSSPLLLKQTVRTKSQANKPSAENSLKKKKCGRPKGSKNKNHREIELPSHLQLIQTYIMSMLEMIGEKLPLRYLLLDGAFGNNNALQMSLRCGLHLISKLRVDAALYFPYEGPQKKWGARKKYGAKVAFDKLDRQYLVATSTHKQLETRLYGFHAWSKNFPDPLNVAVIVKINQETGQLAHVVLFSSDLTLETTKLVDLYTLRFQIEFNFRDAKQFWGLEDFMNVKEQQVTNAANLSMFMVNVSHALADQMSLNEQTFSLIDLKALYRGRKYVLEVLKYLPHPPDRFFIHQLFANVGLLGSVNRRYKP